MTDKELTKQKRLTGKFAIALSIIFFANPTVRLFDIMPDFIACFIIARALKFLADRAPFFAEARSAFIKLGIVSLAKLPAFFVLISVRSIDVSDYDISVLLTFSFAVIDAIYFTSAINNLFAALFYLGGRSKDTVLIRPFKTSSNEYSGKTMKPETLKTVTLAFTYFKLVAGALPEMLLLSSTDDTGMLAGHTRGFIFYPYVLIFFVLLTIGFGVVYAMLFSAYARGIRSWGKIHEAADALVRDEARRELDVKIEKRRARWALDLMIISCVFLFAMRFDNLGQINLIPICIFAPMLTYALVKLWKSPKQSLPVIISGIFSFAALLVYQISEFIFLDNFSYDLMVTDKKAKSEYVLTMNTHFVATLIFIIFIVCCAIALLGFAKKKLIKPDEPGADRLRADRYRSIRRRTVIWSVIGSLVMVCKFGEVVFKYFPDVHAIISDKGQHEFITSALIPWFSTVVFVVAGVFLAYTMYLVSSIKDDIEVYIK